MADSQFLAPRKREKRTISFDKALDTRKWCVIGLALAYLSSFVFIATGAYAYAWSERNMMHNRSLGDDDGDDHRDVDRTVLFSYPNAFMQPKPKPLGVSLSLLLNIDVTVKTEALAFIHATSLRWSLYHKGRLHHNSNLRLFTSLKMSGPNRLYINAIWGLTTVFGYGGASQSIADGQGMDDNKSWSGLNPIALLFFGGSLLVQCAIATWCLSPSHQRSILSWSSDPLNTALALSLVSYNNPASINTQPATLPRKQQKSVIAKQRNLSYILAYLWVLVPAICVGGIAAFIYKRKDYYGHFTITGNEICHGSESDSRIS